MTGVDLSHGMLLRARRRAIEHVRPRNRVLGWLFDVLSPLTRRLFGPSINRRTEQNILAAGLRIVDARHAGIRREIRAVRGDAPAP